MKRLLLLVLFVGSMSLEAEAQSWLQLLQNLFGGSSKSEEVVEEPKFITANQLLGDWLFASTEIEYAGNDPLASMGVSAMKGQAADLAAKAGVVVGRDKATFNSMNRASLQIGDRKVEGNYRYNPQTGEITLSIEIGQKHHALTGKTHYENGTLKLLFNTNEALAALKEALPSMAQNDYVKVGEQIITAYPGIQIGASFHK